MDSVACRLIEVKNLNDKKKKRYPTDRLKLHALLEKKEQDLIELQEEVEELRRPHCDSRDGRHVQRHA